MPLVQIHLVKGRSPQFIKAVADGVHRAFELAWDIPSDARFQVIHQHGEDEFYLDKRYWNMSTDKKKAVVITIGMTERSKEKKHRFFEELVKILADNPGVQKENLFVQLIPCSEENWLY